MFKEILQIIPKLSNSDLSSMERTLSSRFGNIAKKFGKGLLATLTGGGIAGAAIGIVDKLLNPLKETQDAIDRTLKQGDDIVTNAKQFGTTAGKLFRLQQLAKSTGLDEGSLDVLLTKFQGAIAEAVADPKKQTSVRKFVIDQKTLREQAQAQRDKENQPGFIGPKSDPNAPLKIAEQDIAETFFEFIQSLQKLPKEQQVLVQQEVFGEKQILKMADFLQTDFEKQTKLVGGPSAEKLTPALEKTANLNDLKDALEARRNLDQTLERSQSLTAEMVKKQDERAKIDFEKEQRQIQSYDNLDALAQTSARIEGIAQTALASFSGMIVKLTNISENMKKISDSPALKGILRWVGGK